MKKIVNILTLLSSCLLVTSCYYDELPQEPVPADVKFSTDVQKIFDQNCIGCHKGEPNTAPNLTRANSYLSLTTEVNGEVFVISGDASNSILYKVMSASGGVQMPPNAALNSTKQKTVEKWINDGAPNN